MKKSLIFTALLLILGFGVKAYTAPPVPVQDVGAQSLTSITTLTISTTPTILLSTGSNNPCIPGWIPGVSTNSSQGQYMCGRIYLEIQNGSTWDIWMGTAPDVSTVTAQGNSRYGIKIASFTTRIDADNNSWWYVKSSSTAFPIVVIQKR